MRICSCQVYTQIQLDYLLAQNASWIRRRMNNDKQTTLDLHTSQRVMPKYERLKDHILGELQSGRLRPGDVLPTELELATQLKVARNTVRQALAELERDGIVHRIRGKGTFINQNGWQSQMKSQDMGLFAIVLPELLTAYYPDLQHGFESVISENHAQVIVSSAKNDPVRQSHEILQLISKSVSGVAILPTSKTSPKFQFNALQKQGIPLVFCARRVSGVQAPLVYIPYLQVGRMAGEELVKHGHRRVAMYYTLPKSGISASPSPLDYAVGLREVLRRNGSDLPEELILYSDTDTFDPCVQEKEAWQNIEKLFSRPDHPTAIMVSYDNVAEMVYVGLQRMGLRIPEDVSIISFGSKKRQGTIIRRLQSVVIDGEEIGRRAASLLNEMCNGQRSILDDEEIMMPLSLSDGESLGPAK